MHIGSVTKVGSRRWALLAALVLTLPVAADAQHPAHCLSMDPGDWPLPARPYFMIAYDSSGSMMSNVSGSPQSSCGYGSRRQDHARCAVYNTVTAFGGVSFGFAQFATFMDSCSGAFNSWFDDGATCNYDFYRVIERFNLYDTGFRCCFSADPTQ